MVLIKKILNYFNLNQNILTNIVSSNNPEILKENGTIDENNKDLYAGNSDTNSQTQNNKLKIKLTYPM